MRKFKKVPKRIDRKIADERLRKGLKKLKKEQLIELLVKLARGEDSVMAILEEQVELEAPPYAELLVLTRMAVDSATDFDEREINRNFDYDGLAYRKVERNFGKLIELGGLDDVMKLALLLMKQGSYQASLSDEGLMCDDIEACLKVVINAVKNSDLSSAKRRAWCEELIRADRTGLICSKEIKSLNK